MQTKFVQNKIWQVALSSLPFMYMYISRLGTLARFLQFFGGEIIPISIITYLLLNGSAISVLISTSFIYFILLALLAFFTFFTIYEIGYIVNDCVFAKRESNPTLRFKHTEYWRYLVCLKLVFFVILVVIGYFFFNSRFLYLFPYGALVLIIFLVHNKLAIEDRGVTYFWLEFTRLMVLPFLFIADLNGLLIGFLLLIPELIRRTIRYLKIKYVSAQHNFTIFDLKSSLLSIAMVSLFLLEFKSEILLGFLLAYSIIIAGILLSIYNIDKRYGA